MKKEDYKFMEDNDPEVTAWLERALKDKEVLPKTTPDEAPFVSIKRAGIPQEKIKNSCLVLIERLYVELAFYEHQEIMTIMPLDVAYYRQLLFLISDLKIHEALRWLIWIVLKHFYSVIPLNIRLAILATILDTPPGADYNFWEEVFSYDSNVQVLAFTGMLRKNPLSAIKYLPKIISNEARTGDAIALHLELFLDDFLNGFIKEIKDKLPECNQAVTTSVSKWIKHNFEENK